MTLSTAKTDTHKTENFTTSIAGS